MIRSGPQPPIIVFVNTKKGCDVISRHLEKEVRFLRDRATFLTLHRSYSFCRATVHVFCIVENLRISVNTHWRVSKMARLTFWWRLMLLAEVWTSRELHTSSTTRCPAASSRTHIESAALVVLEQRVWRPR